MRIRAVTFDMFETLAFIDWTQLPSDELVKDDSVINRVRAYSYRTVEPELRDTTFREWCTAWKAMWEFFQETKTPTRQEVPAPRRFAWLFEQLGYRPYGSDAELCRTALEGHFSLVERLTYIPDGVRRMLKSLAERMPLTLISNYDYSPSLRRILRKEDVYELFREITISMDLGLRKPHHALFERSLLTLEAAPREILHVGDNPQADVEGAMDCGMAALWVNPKHLPRPRGVREPSGVLESVTEVPAWLETRS